MNTPNFPFQTHQSTQQKIIPSVNQGNNPANKRFVMSPYVRLAWWLTGLAWLGLLTRYLVGWRYPSKDFRYYRLEPGNAKIYAKIWWCGGDGGGRSRPHVCWVVVSCSRFIIRLVLVVVLVLDYSEKSWLGFRTLKRIRGSVGVA